MKKDRLTVILVTGALGALAAGATALVVNSKTGPKVKEAFKVATDKGKCWGDKARVWGDKAWTTTMDTKDKVVAMAKNRMKKEDKAEAAPVENTPAETAPAEPVAEAPATPEAPAPTAEA